MTDPPEVELALARLDDLRVVANDGRHGVFALVVMVRDPATVSMGVTELHWHHDCALASVGDAKWLALRFAPSTAHRLGVGLRDGQQWCLVIGPVTARVVLVDLVGGDVTG